MKQNLIKQWRQSGVKCRVLHSRFLKGSDELHSLKEIREKKLQNLILGKGGRTVLQTTTKDGKDYEVIAFCNKSDSFNRRVSIAICSGRMAKLLGN